MAEVSENPTLQAPCGIYEIANSLASVIDRTKHGYFLWAVGL
jgi:hypothetical protein